MTIILASDHRGFQLKQLLKSLYPHAVDVGPSSPDPNDDYVDYANAALKTLGPDDRAILICGSGHGMDIVANRYPHVRGILGFNHIVTKQGREHENANVLILPADHLSKSDAQVIVDIFLNTPFSNEPRHLRRLQKLNDLTLNTKH